MSKIYEQDQQGLPSEAAQTDWICAVCGENNTGKYCTECGKKNSTLKDDDTIRNSFSNFSSKEDNENMKNDKYPPKDITKLEISYYNSDTHHSFRFALSNSYRANNIMFDCDCYTEDKTMIQLNGIPVDFTYMEKMCEIAAKHDFAKMKPRDLDNYKDNPEKISVSLDLSWAGGVKLRVDYWPDTGVDELLDFFWGIVNTLMGGDGKLPLRAADIIALSYGGRALPRHCKYELREQADGKIMLSWPSRGGETGWDIYTNTVYVDYIYMDRLRGIVEQCGLLDPKPGMLKILSPDEYLYPYEEDLKPAPLEVFWKTVQLPYTRLKISKPTNGGENLLEFFRNLAITHAKKAETKFSHRSGPTR